MLPHPLAGLEFSDREIASAVERQGLLSVELEMTCRCNLRCTYCYSRGGEAIRDEMTPEEIEGVVGQAVALGAKKVVVLGGGEPLLYPELRALVRLIVRLGVQVELFTNGTLVTAEWARFFWENRVAVVVKRNSLTAAVQDALAGQAGAFAAMSRGLDELLKAGYPGPEHGLGIQTIICRQNLAEIPTMWRWARTRRIQPYFECLTYQGRATDHNGLHVSASELGELFHRLSEMDRREFGFQWEPHPPLAGASCRRHLYSILVKADGRVYPCVGVELCVGDIRRSRLEEIIRESDVVQDLRHVYGRLKGTCGSCLLSGQCYGCRGNAFQMTGDYLASDPLCWVGQGEAGGH